MLQRPAREVGIEDEKSEAGHRQGRKIGEKEGERQVYSRDAPCVRARIPTHA